MIQIARVRQNGDRILALALAGGLVVETVVVGSVRGDEPVVAPLAAQVAALLSGLALTASLAMRRQRPNLVIALAILAAAASLTAPLDAPIALLIAMMIASYSVGAHTDGRGGIAGAIGVLTLIAVGVAKDLGPDHDLADLALPILLFGGPALAGLAIRSRREREAVLERSRLEHADAAVADERARIARELHDAIAHAIGVVVLQARGARRMLATDPGQAAEALDAIETTATHALAEMRRLVGVLRQDDEALALAPPPSLRHLDALVDRVRDAGLPVDVVVEGTPTELPPGIDLSAYRIVQEALTNALAHAGPAAASVVIRYGPEAIDLQIVDTGLGPASTPNPGHGLVGMRERVALYAGTLDTDLPPGGGFAVSVRLPITREP